MIKITALSLVFLLIFPTGLIAQPVTQQASVDAHKIYRFQNLPSPDYYSRSFVLEGLKPVKDLGDMDSDRVIRDCPQSPRGLLAQWIRPGQKVVGSKKPVSLVMTDCNGNQHKVTLRAGEGLLIDEATGEILAIIRCANKVVEGKISREDYMEIQFSNIQVPAGEAARDTSSGVTNTNQNINVNNNDLRFPDRIKIELSDEDKEALKLRALAASANTGGGNGKWWALGTIGAALAAICIWKCPRGGGGGVNITNINNSPTSSFVPPASSTPLGPIGVPVDATNGPGAVGTTGTSTGGTTGSGGASTLPPSTGN